MEIVLFICSILGAIAAIIYFADKLKPIFSLNLSIRKPPAIPIDQLSLSAYVKSYRRPRFLAKDIAEENGLPYKEIDSDFIWLLEKVNFFKIKTIRDLDNLVKKYSKSAKELAHYVTPKNGVDSGFVVSLVLEIYAIERGGLEELVRLCSSLKYTSAGKGWANDIYHAYQQIKKYS